MKFEELDLTEVTQHKKRIHLTEDQINLPVNEPFLTISNKHRFYREDYNVILYKHYRIREVGGEYTVDFLNYSYDSDLFSNSFKFTILNNFTSNYYPITFYWDKCYGKYDTIEQAEEKILSMTQQHLEEYNDYYHKEPDNIVKHYW